MLTYRVASSPVTDQEVKLSVLVLRVGSTLAELWSSIQYTHSSTLDSLATGVQNDARMPRFPPSQESSRGSMETHTSLM